ncbi:MAG: hypothetical protein QM754_02400 [Tepidisphaeraceae bacterium]
MIHRPNPVSLAVVLTVASLAVAEPASQPATYVGATTANTYQPVDSVAAALSVKPIDDALRQSFEIPAFYRKAAVIRGIPVIGSEKVSDYAFLEIAYQIDRSLADSPKWVIDALQASKVRMGIIACVEYTMDIPENQTPENLVPKEAAFQDRRSRGLGGLPLATCGEENLLNLRGDPYYNENITLHEFSHTLASAIQEARPEWYRKLRQTYRQAMKEGLFASSYSATNEQEYWAEGVQAWFNCASPKKDAKVHSGIWYREQLRAYDPRLAALIEEVYGDGTWRYVKSTNEPVTAGGKTYTRPEAELAHLVGIDRTKMPRFDFNNSPRIQAYKPEQK